MKGRAIEVRLEKAGKNKQHGFATKKSIIKVVLGTVTTVLEFERKLHLRRSSFPFFGKLSSGSKQKNRTSAQNWHKAAEKEPPSHPVQPVWMICKHREPSCRLFRVVVGEIIIFFFLKRSLS